MSLPDALEGLPDTAPCALIVGSETHAMTLGELRERLGGEEKPQGSDWEDEVVRIAVQRGTENLCEDSWAASEYGPTPQDGAA